MKRILMMLAMVAVVAVACDPASPEAKLELSETTLSLDAVSGGGNFYSNIKCGLDGSGRC